MNELCALRNLFPEPLASFTDSLSIEDPLSVQAQSASLGLDQRTPFQVRHRYIDRKKWVLLFILGLNLLERRVQKPRTDG